MKARSNQNQVIAGSGATPSLFDTATLTAPHGVFLSDTLSMVRGDHTQLRVVLVTLFGPDHPNPLEMKKVNTEIM